MFRITVFSLLFALSVSAQTPRSLQNRQYRVMPPTSGPQKPVGTFYQDPSGPVKSDKASEKSPQEPEKSVRESKSGAALKSAQIQQQDLASVGKGSLNVFSSEDLETYQRAAIALTEGTVFLSCDLDGKKVDKKERINQLVKNLIAGIQKAKFFKTSDEQPTLAFRWTSTDKARRTEVYVYTKEDQKKIESLTLAQQKLKDKVKGPLATPEVQQEYVSEKTTICSIEGLKEK